MVNDPIADMLTRLRNAILARQKVTDIPFSKIRLRLAEILQREGYLEGFEIRKKTYPYLALELKYEQGQFSVINGLKRKSRPGRRLYLGHREISLVREGLGIGVFSTSKGVLTDKEARQLGIGGEYLCEVW